MACNARILWHERRNRRRLNVQLNSNIKIRLFYVLSCVLCFLQIPDLCGCGQLGSWLQSARSRYDSDHRTHLSSIDHYSQLIDNMTAEQSKCPKILNL